MSTSGEGTNIYSTVTCPNCGEVILLNARYCPNCGFTLSMKAKVFGKGFHKKGAKEAISKAFQLAVAVAWSLFSLVLSFWLYSFLASFEWVAQMIGLRILLLHVFALVSSAILFLHVFAPVAVRFKMIEKRNYGAIVFLCWLVLSSLNAISMFALTSEWGYGTIEALATTTFYWIIYALFFAFVNSLFFEFPFSIVSRLRKHS